MDWEAAFLNNSATYGSGCLLDRCSAKTLFTQIKFLKQLSEYDSTVVAIISDPAFVVVFSNLTSLILHPSSQNVCQRFEVQLEVEQRPGQTSREKGLLGHNFRPYHRRRERGRTELADVEQE